MRLDLICFQIFYIFFNFFSIILYTMNQDKNMLFFTKNQVIVLTWQSIVLLPSCIWALVTPTFSFLAIYNIYVISIDSDGPSCTTKVCDEQLYCILSGSSVLMHHLPQTILLLYCPLLVHPKLLKNLNLHTKIPT